MKKNQLARLSKSRLKKEIMNFFRSNPRGSFNHKQVASALGITRHLQKLIIDSLLTELLSQHFLQEERPGKYRLVPFLQKERKIMGDDIMGEFDLPESYPSQAEEAANSFSGTIPNEEYSYREDFRAIPTLTIDPAEAKDFDDALSLRKLPNGHWEVGVHIADVTFYVKPGSIIDQEAERRATSVYLVDRTIPMLPESLCNGLCSLRPDEEKRCFSCIFELDEKAKVLASRIKRTVIKSDKRLTYEEAQEVIEQRSDTMKEVILPLLDLARILRDQRIQHGAIQFASNEVSFRLNEQGDPVEVLFRESNESHWMIEEFMLLANRTVAEFVSNNSTLPKAFVYRIHDVPDPDKLNDVSRFVKRFGYQLNTTGSKKEVNQSINHLLTDCKGKNEENIVSSITVRAMAKAVYSTDNIGHYGLAFKHYTHFTSPIRRYPDLLVHRLLERYLNGGKSFDKERLERACEHCSAMENLATQAERASIKCMQIRFMADKLGKVFKAVISGVTEFGLFVEIEENKCEGLVSVRDLEDDHYDYDEKNYCLRGRRYKKEYRLGDSVQVMVARTNLDRRQLDFVLAEEPTENEES